MLQRDERLDDLARHRLGNADHACLGHGRMLHQRTFYLERADQVTGALDHIVGTADEPVVALGVAHGEIAGQVPAADKALAVSLLFVEVGPHHRWPARAQCQLAHRHRLCNLPDLAIRGALDHGGCDSRQRPAHRSGLHVHREVVGDHDAPGLRLPPVVMERLAEGLDTPDDGFGIERFADARQEAQLGQIEALGRFGADFHQHADGGRRRVPDGDLLVLQYPIPALGIELGLVDDQRRAVGERRDDAVGGAGHPAGVRRAPEDVLRMEVERKAPGDVMRDHGLVHVHRALRPTRGAAGEVQQGHVLGGCRHDLEGLRCRRHRRGEVHRAGWRTPRAVGEKDVPQAGQLLAPGLDFAPVQGFRSDQALGVPDRHARLDRLRAEGREQGAEDAAVLQRAESREVELRHPPEQREHPVALGDAQLPQQVGKPVGMRTQGRVGEIAHLIVTPDPPHGEHVAAAGGDMTVDRLMGNVEPATGQAVQQPPRLRPRERPRVAVVVLEVGADAVLGALAD